jgi:uncharacterized membrane protein
MNSTIDPGDRRIRDLERRVARIELRLGIVLRADDDAQAANAEMTMPPDRRWRFRKPSTSLGGGSAAAERPSERSEPEPSRPIAYEQAPALPPPIPKSLSAIPASDSHLEQTIGLKWAGWIGAVVLVIGAVLGVRFAYENGWFGHVPPVVRLAAIVAGGAALIAAGEVVYRRINIISAASVFGAGVATLFVAAHVGHAYYDLYARPTAMACLGLAALVGAGVAMRGNLVSIAVLSLVGANVAPLLLRSPDAPVAPSSPPGAAAGSGGRSGACRWHHWRCGRRACSRDDTGTRQSSSRSSSVMR